MEFRNAYADARRAAAYDQLGFPGTYQLAFRDLPTLLREHTAGWRAVDFGCGTGRSTRFLKGLGFATIGLDIAPEMVALARRHDPVGDYRVIADGDFSGLPAGAFDLVLSAFTFDNIPDLTRRVGIFRGLATLLAPAGRLVNLVSTPEIYTHEWASFTTRDFPENQLANSGDIVRVITTDHPDARPVEDIVWTDAAYRETYRRSGLAPVRVERPLARGDEPIAWVSETTVAPWAIYVLKREEPETMI
ncbi:MAG: class I SAM-dependent methyltransferase [Candidatus Krumholzibacteriia bacterium]